jgi:hypothetical protein
MKPYFSAAVCAALAAASLAAAPRLALAAQPDDAQVREAQRAANEAAGLPDLTKINRPAAEVTSKVDINDVPRTPSYYEKSRNGTEIIEYRDRGKPVEIDVHSNFGTRYQMSASPDTSPQVHSSAQPSTRLPSINLRY